jgi:capsular polysaccharide biosynthesis protein
MNVPVWRIEDDGEVQLPASPTAEAGLVSLPFLVAAVRRGWRRVVITALACAFLALGLTRLMAGQPSAMVTLYVVSDPNLDPSAAMTTNLSLLGTRTLAQHVVDNHDLPTTPEALQASVKGGVLSDQLMTVTVSAPTKSDAKAWANDLAQDYLVYRAQQISASAASSVKANNALIQSLQGQIADLTKRADRASASGQAELATTLSSQRAQMQASVSAAQQANSETDIQNRAIIGASHVVDDATLMKTSGRRTVVLAVVSGLIGGTALGLALVLAPAVLSTRLRRRDDVARALGLPVRFSAGRVRSRWWWLPGRQDSRNAERLAHGLATALSEGADPARLTVATIGDVRDGASVVGALADELAREPTRVAVVDLSSSNALAKPSWFQLGRRDPVRNRSLVKVHRHGVRVSELAARSGIGLSSDKELSRAEVILTLIELDLGSGVDALGDLGQSSVVLVSAGRVTAERLRSSATLLRQSGMRPAFAMLVGADDTDDSSGLLGPIGDRDMSTRRSS